MISSIANLPDSTEDLKKIITEREQYYQIFIKCLEEKVSYLEGKLFGRKSEKISTGKYLQTLLFDEVEDTVDESLADDEDDKIIVPAHKRKKPGRKPLPENLPRVERIHDLTEAEKMCDCGIQMECIGREISEKLDVIPAKVVVIRHIRPKYACKNCEGVESEESPVKIAPPPPQLIPKSIATAGLIAYIIAAKFVDGLPLFRQEKIFARLGVLISRATMANWLIKVAEQCKPLLALLQQGLLSGPLINIDETPIQVLDEPGRANTTKSYMWVFRGGSIGQQVLIFQYHPTRSGKVVLEFLAEYEGYIQTDGYNGYDELARQSGIIHVGCWVHARRNFVDVLKAMGGGKKKKGNAPIALSYIGKLYQIEREAKEKELSVDEIYQLRQKRSKPILEEFKKWLTEKYPQTPPRGLLGKAISYCLNRWGSLERYLEDGRLQIDNNLIENAIRPFALGRKNWLFSGNPRGAEASAALYSLIETAKMNGLDPYWYLRFLFEKLPLAKTKEDYKALLPHYIDKEELKSFKQSSDLNSAVAANFQVG
jgi:transposase